MHASIISRRLHLKIVQICHQTLQLPKLFSANNMKHADYRSFDSDELHMNYSSPEDEEALLPEVNTTVPRSRSLKKTLITGFFVVITVVSLGFLVVSSQKYGAKNSPMSPKTPSMAQSFIDGKYIDRNKFTAEVESIAWLTVSTSSIFFRFSHFCSIE